MFGYVMADSEELTQAERARYAGCYCGICRAIQKNASNACRLALSYDMVFLALLLSSLYEPEEGLQTRKCALHPLRKQSWLQSDIISYAADMNVALAYYNADDHWRDSKRLDALAQRALLRRHCPAVSARYPRQCNAIADEIAALNLLEQSHCGNPDLPANCFGRLMQQLFLYRQDQWSQYLSQMAMALGRFIYLMDAAVDYRKDLRQGAYNPLAAMDEHVDPARWEQYLVLAMAKCTQAYEMLPLVQDKPLLDKILYSGVWIPYRKKQKKAQEDPT